MRHKDDQLLEKIRQYIQESILNQDHSPTTREIAKVMGISKSGAQRYVVALREANRINYEDGRLSNQITDKMNKDREKAAVLANQISCGAPQYEEENIEAYVNLPTLLFGEGEKYILTASGDSMVGAGIEEGDTIVIRKQREAKNGEIVVALLNGENTLKRLYYNPDGKPFLHPENPRLSDIQIEDGDEFYIQGVATQIIKTL